MAMSKTSFTVEQVELIRRIRNSGITCQQVVDAFQAFDRIDTDLGTIYSTPSPSLTQAQHHKKAVNSSGSSISILSSALISSSPSEPLMNGSSGLQTQALNRNVVVNTAAPRPASRSINGDQRINSGPDDASLEGHNLHHMHNGVSHSNTSFDNNVSNNSKPTLLQSSKSEPQDFDMERCTDLLLSQSCENILELYRKCIISLPDFNPLQVASLPGISERAVAQILSGDFQSVEQPMRNMALEWFIHHLRRTEWFPTELNFLLRSQETEGLGVHFVPRRERFMFQEKHLEVLETFIKKVQYPTPEEKEHIANECNKAQAELKDRELGEKEKMTAFNVSNWFSNRRKEIKRLAKTGGIDTEKVILPSRVKAKPQSNLPTYSELVTEEAHRFLPMPVHNSFEAKYSTQAVDTINSPTDSTSSNQSPVPGVVFPYAPHTAETVSQFLPQFRHLISHISTLAEPTNSQTMNQENNNQPPSSDLPVIKIERDDFDDIDVNHENCGEDLSIPSKPEHAA